MKRLALVALWAWWPAGLLAQSALSWTPELVLRFRAVSDVAMSPDGDLVAYVVREALTEGEKSEYLSHIWVASRLEGWSRQYTRGDKSCTAPAFSPDGRYLAFLSTRSGRNQIWLLPMHGGEAEQLTDVETGVTGFRWAPDGRSLAFLAPDPETPEERQRKREKRDAYVLDGDFKYQHLYRVPVEPNAQGKRPIRRLTRGAFHVASFDWTPDGRRIVFAHQPDPRLNTGLVEVDLSWVPADSGSVTALVRRPGVDTNPKVSPDGRWVAFTSHGGQPERIGLADVWVVPLEGGQPRKLADTPDRNATLLGWSADGRYVFVEENVRVDRHVLRLPADGRAPEFLTRGPGVYGQAAFDRNTRWMAFTYENSDTPVEVYTSAVERFAPQRLSRLNVDVPLPPIGRTEVLRWRSFDGLEIEGLLIYPVDYQPGRRYPLILNVHGGPAGVFSRTFTGRAGIYLLQYFAQHGYALLLPNPRGSTGYGKDFRYANVRDWGYGDFEDLMSGVDEVIRRGVAHPDSLAIMGWSYGGYMTAFAVTRTSRFKAASMGAGLSNLISMVTTTDIPDYLVAHMGAEFWEDYATYAKHSAIYQIQNVRTPTQIIHGENDRRVPFSQGLEMYVALKRRNVPTEMVVLPRTPHGPTEPKLLLQVSGFILDWFERHLRGRARVVGNG
ncbi:MAG: S9 family peptidase [Bacteroidetes bacterium]|nr:S9 family peptidase [Bacteroidota bacterium]